jgi:hypothetical protein
LENIIGLDAASFADTKAEFMKAYAPRYTAKTLCTIFQDLRQKQDQSVQDFYNHVSDVFRDAYQVKPEHVLTCPAARHGLTQAQGDELRLGGIVAMQLLMMNTVFIGGLREEIRVKVLETGPTRIQESVDLGRQIEVIVHDKKVKGTTVSSIIGPDGDSEDKEQEVLEIINAVRARRGKAPFQFRAGQRSTGGMLNKSNVQCHYCKFMGHYQRDCRKRIQAKAKMVFPQRINRIGLTDGNQEDKDDGDDQATGQHRSEWNSLNY